MTQVTPPPGWYSDPGQTSDGPRTERWWDGSVWTDHTRPVGSAGAWGPPTMPSGAPPYPAYPVYPAKYPRRGLRTAIGAGVALAVLAGIAGGVYALTSDDAGGGRDRADSAPSGAPSLPGGPGGGPGGESGAPRAPESGGPSGGPRTEDGYATDLASGISLPVPDGWNGQSGAVGAGVTTGTYKCPGDTSESCVRGGAFSVPAAALDIKATTAEAAAKADIEKNAEESYGGKIYGKITSHDELVSKAVTVAGQKGYQVRWKVVTAKGDDGYVESLAFPSPADKDTLVVVRFGIDVSDEAPKVSLIDEITKGIKAASGGGGNGREV
ncbi:DUF2510 domain-containing protein [Streptomyces himalayensis]|uniref:DUF2510 domain-containing protein n=1 Tax=Streptomyces himalayensis subsp. himalayensis TaxID=2756131 RepID=A0A7W0DQF5_9ACTN|nr:DUF2510 domain-containing protein [Streptomyces himalayensis]MBA2949362.1 DUF2510 domain-containing protein [Streptomyces himalayensis subsp. himalayensis]